MMYSLIQDQDLINDINTNGVHHFTLNVSSNYRDYVATIHFMTLNNSYYFKESDNCYYQFSSNDTINHILKFKYSDYDHFGSEHSTACLCTIPNGKNISVEIYEKGNILYKD